MVITNICMLGGSMSHVCPVQALDTRARSMDFAAQILSDRIYKVRMLAKRGPDKL